MECGNIVTTLFKSSSDEKTDHGYRWLLRARSERPYRYTAEKNDELAPPHCSRLKRRSYRVRSACAYKIAIKWRPMSALGHKRTFAAQNNMSALPQNQTCAVQSSAHYSITSSARARTAGGIVRPSALAVLRLITSSYLVGACTGKSAGFSPLRMRST